MTKTNPTEAISTRTQLGKRAVAHRSAFGRMAEIVLVACALVSCRKAVPVAATLIDRQGSVERAIGSGWTDAYVGFAFAPGDALRTGTESRARVRIPDGRVVRVGPHAHLRFARGGARPIREAPELSVDLGTVEVESPAAAPAAEPVAAPRPVETAPAVVEAAPAVVEAAPAVVEAAPAVVETAPAVVGAAPAEVTVAAGESAVVRDSRAGLRVRLRFDNVCPGTATVDIVRVGRGRRRLTGEGAVSARLWRGQQIYRVRCSDQTLRSRPRAAGVLSLKRVPRTTIDGDGRRYALLFQERPPALVLAWPRRVHPAKPLLLHIVSPAGERVLRVKGPRTRLRSGALPEGTHTWWYAAGNGAQSPRTIMTLRLDGTAPVAQLLTASAALAAAPAIAARKPPPVDDGGRAHISRR